MRDKSLDILLMVVFGISGMVILMLAWLRPMLEEERILTTVIGSAGLLMTFHRALLFKFHKVEVKDKSVPVETRDRS